MLKVVSCLSLNGSKSNEACYTNLHVYKDSIYSFPGDIPVLSSHDYDYNDTH